MTKQIFAFFMLFFVAATANANLLVNGSFEDNNVSNGAWQWFNAQQVAGWDGSNIEIWDDLYGFESFDGDQHAELNAHGQNGQVFSISQTFDTAAGYTYDVSFAYAARANNNEVFLFEIVSGNTALVSDLMDDHTVRTWIEHATSFVAQSTQTTIRFTSIVPSTGTVGNFIDDVVVTASLFVPPNNITVPEPSFYAVICVLAVMLVRRRKY